MPCCIALTLAAAIPVALPPAPPVPTGGRGAVATATAGVSVEVVRAERAVPEAPAEATRRTLVRDRRGGTIVFE